MDKNIKKSMFAGTWYPGTKEEILKQLDTFFSKAKMTRKIKGTIKVVVCPHAGWIYSGQVDAYGFQYIQGKKFDDVFVLGPSHHIDFAAAALPTNKYFETPLGLMEIDTEAVKFLTDFSAVYKADNAPHIPEHSLEIELPFLQYSLKKGWKLVPIVLGNLDYHGLVSAAKAIAEFSKLKNILIVVSTDMSHYHTYDEACRMDKKAISLAENMDISALIAAWQDRRIEYCGFLPLLTAMLYASQIQATNVSDIFYTNSGDVTGDKSRVVGYTAIIFSKSDIRDPAGGEMLNSDEKNELLALARNSITTFLKTGKKLKYTPENKVLNEHGAVFVTLEKCGNLRGCIGQIIAMEPIYRAVIDMAVSAAVGDPRFPKLSKDELADIQIEISVLTPLNPVKDINDIKIGRDGLYIKEGYHSGLLLPQVATDYGWNVEQFLRQVCNKAGLPTNAWEKDDTELYKFRAVIFSEKVGK